jgi:hypothetical protein
MNDEISTEMKKYVGRTESHEQLLFNATWGQQTKESIW